MGEILLSEDINNDDKENYLNEKPEKNFEKIFLSLKKFLIHSFNSYDKDNISSNYFLYTEKQIKIPIEDIDSDNFNEKRENLQKQYLKKIKINFKNNLIYTFRPLLKQKSNRN